MTCDFDAIRTSFGVTATVLMTDWYAPGDEWERLREKFREEHARTREQCKSSGWILGGMHYVEEEPDDTGRVGEWRSRIVSK